MSSWAALKKIQDASNLNDELKLINPQVKKRKRLFLNAAIRKSDSTTATEEDGQNLPKKTKKLKEYFDVSTDSVNKHVKSKYVALDCEMVGVGANGKRSALARCALVDFDGNVLFDQYVRPQAFVTDFRTKYSGIRSKDLRTGTAISFNDCQIQVSELIKDKILVGHALKNDLDVLMLSHSHTRIRDTASYRPYMRPHPKKKGKYKPRSLKDLAKQYLGKEIQSGEHDPAEDARSAMWLFRRCRAEWEESRRMKRNSAIKPSDSSAIAANK